MWRTRITLAIAGLAASFVVTTPAQAATALSCRGAAGFSSPSLAAACEAATTAVQQGGSASTSLQTIINSSVVLLRNAETVQANCLAVTTSCATALKALESADAFVVNALTQGASCATTAVTGCTNQMATNQQSLATGVSRSQQVSSGPCFPVFHTCGREEELSESGGGWQCCGGTCEMYISYDDHLSVAFEDYIVYAETDVETKGQSYVVINCYPYAAAPSLTLSDGFAFDGATMSVGASTAGVGTAGASFGSTGNTLTTTGVNTSFLTNTYDLTAHGPIWGYGHTSTATYKDIYFSDTHQVKGSQAL